MQLRVVESEKREREANLKTLETADVRLHPSVLHTSFPGSPLSGVPEAYRPILFIAISLCVLSLGGFGAGSPDPYLGGPGVITAAGLVIAAQGARHTGQ